MTVFDLLKLLGGVILAVVLVYFSWQSNYKPVNDKAEQWKKALDEAQKVYDASRKIKEEYDKYQKLSEEYSKLRQEFFGSSQSSGQEVFMSDFLKKLENIVVEVRENTKDNTFKVSNIRFGSITNRNIGSGEEGAEGIMIRSSELSLSISGKYSTIIRFIKELSNKDKAGSLSRIKTISFSPGEREVGKSPVNNVSLTIEMIQILR